MPGPATVRAVARMPSQELNLYLLVRHLDDDYRIGHALFFPEFSTLVAESDRLTVVVEKHVQTLCRQSPLGDLWQRFRGAAPELAETSIEVSPDVDQRQWQEPIALTIRYVRWERAAHAHIAHVPALGIDVFARRAEDLEARVQQEVGLALARLQMTRDIRKLIELDRETSLSLDVIPIDVVIETPIERDARDREEDDTEKPVLDQVGRRLVPKRLEPAHEVDDEVRAVARAIVDHAPGSALLVGPSGVGKTAVQHELVRRFGEFGASARPFYELSGARIIAGMSGFGSWQDRCEKIVAQARRDNAILLLGNLFELGEVGKSANNNEGLAAWFRPVIAQGRITVVAECTAEQLPVLEREVPGLVESLRRIDVTPPDRDRLRRILAIDCASAHDVAPKAIDTIIELHERFAPYSANPGRPLRFLRNLCAQRSDRLSEPARIESSQVSRAFAAETGLPWALIDDAQKLDLDLARSFFTDRIIGQQRAVDLIVDMLATVKSGLTRPRRPIVSLLFVGPTGVGKTEICKALAEFLFAKRERILRFDMSEYADPSAVQRLIGSCGVEGQLTAKVREQPFSVLLFDEFEKADMSFFDLLLQVLGEGRLTDARGRMADFCNTVVVMTSNLAAESFQQGGVGFGGVTGENPAAREAAAEQHFGDAVSQFLRPEIVGRIDRIVPFSNLDAAAIGRIAERELESIRGREGFRFVDFALEIGPDVAAYFARVGFDAQLGARPLKRAIERELIAPIADELNRVAGSSPFVRCRVSTNDGRLVIDRSEDSGQAKWLMVPEREHKLLEACVRLRRQATKLQDCTAMQRLENDIHRISRIERRIAKGARQISPADRRDVDRLADLRALRVDASELLAATTELEDRALIPFFLSDALPGALTSDHGCYYDELLRILETVCSLHDEDAQACTVALFSPNLEDLRELASAYVDVARRCGASVDLAILTVMHDARTKKRDLYMWPVADVRVTPGPDARPRRRDDDSWYPCTGTVDEKDRVRDPIGVVLTLRGKLVAMRFEGTGITGVHSFTHRDAQPQQVLVVSSREPVLRFQPPEGVETNRSYEGAPGIEYDREHGVRFGEKRYPWKTGGLHLVQRMIQDQLFGARLLGELVE